MNKWSLYLLECADGTLYCGITNNLAERIEAHNSGKGAKYTRGRLPVKLVYAEKFDVHKDAAQREFRVKGWSRQKKLNLIKYGRPIK